MCACRACRVCVWRRVWLRWVVVICRSRCGVDGVVGWQEAPVMPGNGCIMQRHARSSRKDQCHARGRAFMAVSFSFNKRFVILGL
jgi:hypothetical protein